ncbi:hypothetical protein E2I00_015519, partial [Balaenoptera physalus]
AVAKDKPRIKPPVLRTTARAMLGSSAPKGCAASFMTLGMAAETKPEGLKDTDPRQVVGEAVETEAEPLVQGHLRGDFWDERVFIQNTLMAIRPHQNGAKGQKRKLPHTRSLILFRIPQVPATLIQIPLASTPLQAPNPNEPRPSRKSAVQRFLSWGLPVSCSRFLWRQRGEFPVSAFLLGAGTGGLLAIGLFQLLVNPMNIYEDQKMVTLYSLVGLGAIGWGTSPHIRCTSLLLVPKMLGKEGRLFVLGYALAAIYEGPVANLRHNLNEVIASLGCTVELQINNTRSAWRVSTAPLRAVFKDLLSSKESLKAKTQNITNSFEELDAQVNNVVNKAMINCRRWFDQKHRECTQRIWVPLLNHLLCLPMKFKFFCGIAKVMEVWCRSRIPVEGNFGQTYDSLNQSIRGLEGEFSATINLKEEKRAGVLGLNTSWEHVSTEVRDYVRRQEAQLEWVLRLLHVLLSCTFLLVLHACFSYVDSYNGDIRFDNIYISTYFCQIDERRKKLGKQTLLPLRKAEKKTGSAGWRAKASEGTPCQGQRRCPALPLLLPGQIRELAETLPVLLLLLLLHKLEVKVGGDSMLARLLRNTIGALNTSSEMVVESNNMQPQPVLARALTGLPPLPACLPQPVPLSTRAYLRAALPSSLLVCLCLLQAFGYRLRRVIAAFYFPKREKKRILFLYNELLRKRAAFTQLRRATIVRRARQQRAPRRHLADILHRRCLPLLRPWLRRRCVVCQAPETPESYVCPTPDCEAVYCRSCWNDMRQRCPVCTPREELSSSAYSDSNDDATYAE